MLRNVSFKKIGLLALAPLALAVGSAHAGSGCSNDNLSVWSSTSTLGGQLTVADGGYGGTSCRLDARITVNGPGVGASVRDNSPSDEPRYRASFILNADNLAGLENIEGVRVFSVNTSNGHLSRPEVVRMGIRGNLFATARVLVIQYVNEGVPGNINVANVNLQDGENVIEIDWDKNEGRFRAWVNNSDENTPTVNQLVNISNWGGVDFIGLGLGAPSVAFRANRLNTDVGFDEFDSRRQTFIGF